MEAENTEICWKIEISEKSAAKKNRNLKLMCTISHIHEHNCAEKSIRCHLIQPPWWNGSLKFYYSREQTICLSPHLFQLHIVCRWRLMRWYTHTHQYICKHLAKRRFYNRRTLSVDIFTSTYSTCGHLDIVANGENQWE